MDENIIENLLTRTKNILIYFSLRNILNFASKMTFSTNNLVRLAKEVKKWLNFHRLLWFDSLEMGFLWKWNCHKTNIFSAIARIASHMFVGAWVNKLMICNPFSDSHKDQKKTCVFLFSFEQNDFSVASQSQNENQRWEQKNWRKKFHN